MQTVEKNMHQVVIQIPSTYIRSICSSTLEPLYDYTIASLNTVLTYCDSESDDYKIRGHTEYAIATYTVLRVFF